MFLDGHNSHITVEIINLAIENKITLICLIPHTTHVLQPLDVSVFKPVKSAWKSIIHEYYLNSGFDNITKAAFPSLLKKLSEKALQPQHATAGFSKCGLFPLNRSKIDAERCTVAESFDSEPLLLSSSINSSTLPTVTVTTASSTSSSVTKNSSVVITNTSIQASPIPASPTLNNPLESINLSLPHARLVPIKSSTPSVDIRSAKVKRNIMASTGENGVSQSQFNALETSILSQLQFNNNQKGAKKHRVDTKGIGGKVLNEESSIAIVKAKEEKKSSKIQTQIDNLEKKRIAVEEKAKKMMEKSEQSRLKIQNLKNSFQQKPQILAKENKENLIKVISCQKCKKKLNEASNSWRACENCDNWFCSLCITGNMGPDDTCIFC